MGKIQNLRAKTTKKPLKMQNSPKLYKKLNLINKRKKMSRQAVTDNIYGLDIK